MLDGILERISKWEHLGQLRDSSGSRVVAHIPRDFPDAYLHSVFAPVSLDKFVAAGLELSDQMQSFYRQCNGLVLFGHSLAIHGARTHYSRDQSSRFQPFGLFTSHGERVRVFHRQIEKSFSKPFFFGSYRRDGSGVFTTLSSTKVVRVLRGSSTPVNEWPDLKSFLETEYDRLDRLFTRDGYLINAGTVTTPAADELGI